MGNLVITIHLSPPPLNVSVVLNIPPETRFYSHKDLLIGTFSGYMWPWCKVSPAKDYNSCTVLTITHV